MIIIGDNDYIYNYNPYKKVFKKPLSKSANTEETEVKLKGFEDEDEDGVLVLDEISIPKFSWEAFGEELYCMDYKLLKHPIIFASTSENNIVKFFNLMGLEICRCNLELPLPFFWELPISMFDIMKERYITAKKMLYQIKSKHEKEVSQKLIRSASMNELEESKTVTFNQLLEQVNQNQASNREPCKFSLRRIEARRRSLLYNDEFPNAQSVMQIDKQKAEKNKHLQLLEKCGFDGHSISNEQNQNLVRPKVPKRDKIVSY